jgi:hypothetical protein
VYRGDQYKENEQDEDMLGDFIFTKGYFSMATEKRKMKYNADNWS